MKKQFITIRFPFTCGLADDVANICAKSNGLEKPLTLKQIASWAECEKVKFPALNGNITISEISSSLLTIDDNKICVLEVKLIES